MVFISWEMTEFSKKTESQENKRRNMVPVFSENFTETMAESLAANDQKFQAAMVAEIKRNFESVRVLID